MQFLVELHRRFNSRRLELLAAQKERQKQLIASRTFVDFLTIPAYQQIIGEGR